MYIYTCTCTSLSVCLCVYVSLSLSLSACLSACLPVCLSACLSVCLYMFIPFLWTQICQTRTYENADELVPPSPTAYPVTATMYTVVVQKDTPQNDPPELETDWLDMLEDEELTFQLRHYDTADDKVRVVQ